MSDSLLTRLFRREADESTETVKEKRSRELVAEFERVKVEFGFVNGGDRTIEYDRFDGRLGEPTTDSRGIRSIENGIYQTERMGST